MFNILFLVQRPIWHSIHLVSFNAIFSVQRFFLISRVHFIYVQHFLFRSTWFIFVQWFVVQRLTQTKLFPSLDKVLSPPFWKTRVVFYSTNGSFIFFEVVILPWGSFRACEKDFWRRDCWLLVVRLRSFYFMFFLSIFLPPDTHTGYVSLFTACCGLS